MTNTIDIRSDKQYKKLKREYIKALLEKKDEFTFDGNVLLVKFAKYLLQHIENIRNDMGLNIYNSKGAKIWKFNDSYKSKEEIWK